MVGAGIKLNAPMIGQGDYLQAQVNYTQGALRYVFQTPNTNWAKVQGGRRLRYCCPTRFLAASCLRRSTATDLQLTTAWNVNAAYEHFWNPRWRTSLYGGYAAVSYNDSARRPLSLVPLDGSRRRRDFDMNWSTWWLGSRTQWNVTKDFYMGLDVMYARLYSAGTRWHFATRAVVHRRRDGRTATWTTGSSASACTAISIPDRVAAV